MQTLDIRRHAQRLKPSQRLSEQGKKLAQSVISKNLQYDLVVTSGLGLADETAFAMVQHVDETIESLSYLPQEIFDKIGWPVDISVIANKIILR